MGRRKKNYSTKAKLDVPESFNLANHLRLMAKSATDAPHIKTTTIQAAGLRELTSTIQSIDADSD